MLKWPTCCLAFLARQRQARIYRYNDSIQIYSNQKLRIRYRFGRASIEYNTNLIKAGLQRKTPIVITIVNLKKCGTVYQIHCEKCNKEYAGETARALEIRVKEHQSRNSSAIYEHCRLEGHSVDPNKTNVLSTEVNTFKRRIKEAIQIKLTKPALNRDNGYELAAIYDTILTPKRR